MTHLSPHGSPPRGPLDEQKRTLRAWGRAQRRAQPEPVETSRRILARALALPEYQAARTVLFYLDLGAEVRTRETVAAELAGTRRIAVPYCEEGELQLFHLQEMAELAPGQYQILEPQLALRNRGEKRVDPREVDLILVPGVVFDRRGARIGAGRGYYDKLLARVPATTRLLGLAFECQLVDELPREPHDRPVHRVLTEVACYPATAER